MKTLQLLPSVFLVLSFLPFIAFSIRIFPWPPVTGMDGRELRLGKPYYMLSTILPTQQGVCLGGNNACPDDVIQCLANSDNPRGLAVTFSSAGFNITTEDVVRENTPYRIEVSVSGNCSGGNLWNLENGAIPFQQFVGVGPGSGAVLFVIQRAFVGYKIVHCALIVPVPHVPWCYSVGFVSQSGNINRMGLGLGVLPSQFMFANVTSNSSTSAVF